MKIVTISGHRQRDTAASPDFLSWRRVAELVGEVSCYWAGPRLELNESGFRVCRRSRYGRLRDLGWLLTTTRAAITEVRSSKGRVVVNGGDPIGWVAALVVGKFAHRPVTLDLHGDFMRLRGDSVGPVRAAVLRRLPIVLARRADAVRVVSPTTLEDLQRRGIHAVLIPPRLAPHWREDETRIRVPLADATNVRLVAVGRLVAQKGFDILLEALAIVRREVGSWITLTIVGDGPLADELRTQADRLGLGSAVYFRGFLSSEAVKGVLLDSDLLVISSRDEGLPRTLMEGVAAGLPIVATGVGGIPALAVDLPRVVVVRPEAVAVARGIVDVLEQPPAAGALAAARRLVYARFEFDVNIAAVAEQWTRMDCNETDSSGSFGSDATWRACLSMAPRIGGREMHVQELTCADRDAGATVRLFYGFGDPHVEGVRASRVRTFPMCCPAVLHSTLFALQVAARLVARRRSRRPRYLHVHGDAYEAAVFSLASRLVSTPVLISVHGRPGGTRGARVAWGIARHGRCRYIGVSSGVVNDLRVRLGCAATIVRQSSGVRASFLTPRFAGSLTRVVSTGLVSERRDFATVLRGAAISCPRLPVRIIGDGPQRPQLESLAQSLGLEAIIAPEMDPDVIADLLSEAIYVQAPSTVGEGFPTSVLEALAIGCPVVTAAFASRADYLDDAMGAAYSSAEELGARISAALGGRLITDGSRVPVPTWQDVRAAVERLASGTAVHAR